MGEVFRDLVLLQECEIGAVMEDHIHMLVIPPKYAVSQVIGYLNGKSAIHVARVYG